MENPTLGTRLELEHREALFWRFKLRQLALRIQTMIAQGLLS